MHIARGERYLWRCCGVMSRAQSPTASGCRLAWNAVVHMLLPLLGEIASLTQGSAIQKETFDPMSSAPSGPL